VTHPILSMLPEEVRATHFEEEVDALSRQIEAETAKGRISALKDKKSQVLPARSRAATSAKGKAQAAHDELVRTYGSGFCHHG
jgi:hypothetical protein